MISTMNLTEVANSPISVTNPVTVQVAWNGNLVSENTPIPVATFPPAVNDLLNSYASATAVAVGASTTNVYMTPTGYTVRWLGFRASSTGLIRMDVQTTRNGTVWATIFTEFNSVTNPNIFIDMGNMSLSLVGTGGLRLLITNEDPTNPQNIYSTLSGVL
jgi:hypothetical protein